MLFSVLHSFTIRYPVHAYTVVPCSSLCSAVFNFTPTFLPPYSSGMVEGEREKVLGRAVVPEGPYSLPGLGLELHAPVRAWILVLQPVVTVGLRGGCVCFGCSQSGASSPQHRLLSRLGSTDVVWEHGAG